MINYEAIERNKSKIVNIGIIVLALIVAFQLYNSANSQVGILSQQEDNELEKNKVVEDIVTLEKKADIYNKTFVKKDLPVVMDIISGIAKDTSVKIVSIKPYTEETLDNYLNASFSVTLSAPSYHALGNFISELENHKDIYLVSEININSASPVGGSEQEKNATDLSVALKINTVSYINK
ncbi:MAG: type 4a pilus biogenesis protein PilO [Candidatus Omnitrophica bacterium]|jgi:hypothetical protein|nr:type 4a pilus biogenesis protein PilO [Candidatus Omnitrophota bacterium]MDD3275071.1 type 4a pilus biogenesis protein PilO [Candidatus Omnitrophota bacterium]MDD5724913.1 type 4a pilus biogenesis protein PilO [Candidatus Omnitrophota bacterium]